MASLGGLVGMIWQSQQQHNEALARTDKAVPQLTKKPTSSSIAECGTSSEQTMAEPAVLAEDPELALLRNTLEGPANAVPGEAMLTFSDAAALKRFTDGARAQGVALVAALSGQPTGRFAFKDLEQLQAALKASKDKPAVEPNLWHTVPQLPREDAGNQGGAAAVGEQLMASIGAGADRSTWGQGVKVAVLDTGIKAHPTFRVGQLSHYDLVQDGSVAHSHGTSVASLIAGEDERVPGVAPAAQLLDIRVANEKGLSVSSVIAQGIYTALEQGAQVINISMGGEGDSPMLRRAVEDAWARGAIVVAAAGNEKQSALAFPAAIPRVISVGSVDAQRRQAYFSNSGFGLDLVAPGVGLITAWDTDKLAHTSGTSHSTGLVSGAIAAMLSKGYNITDIERTLKNWAVPTGASADRVGSGVIMLRF
jgi:thermitase